MSTFSRAQFISGTEADPSTLSITPTAATSILIAEISERSGGDYLNHTLSDGGATGGDWVRVAGETIEQLNTGARHSVSTWWKLAGSTASVTLSADDTTANAKLVTVAEYATDTGGAWSFVNMAQANTGAGSVSPVSVGPTASAPSGDTLAVILGMWRPGGTDIDGTFGVTGGFAGNVVSPLSGSGRMHSQAWQQTTGGATFSGSVTWGGTGHEAAAAIVVFQQAAGAVQLTPPLLTRSKTIYAPIVSDGSQVVAPALLTRAKTIYSPTVSGGALLQEVTGLRFETGGTSGTGAATFEMDPAPSINAMTYIWWERLRTSSDQYYRGGFIVHKTPGGTFTPSESYIMPVLHGTDGTFNTSTGQRTALAASPFFHEIATDGLDFIASQPGLVEVGETQESYPAEYGVWRKRVLRTRIVGSDFQIIDNVDLDNPTKVIRHAWAASSITATDRAMFLGKVPWATENYYADVFGLSVYTSFKTNEECQTEFANFTNTPALSDCYFRNVFPEVVSSEIPDLKGFGTAHPFALITAATPGTFTEDIDVGPVWQDLPGETGTSYTTPTLTADMDGWQYRWVATNPYGSATSATATQTVTLAGPQTLSPSLLTRTKTIYVPTVSAGAVTLSPTLLTRTKVLYAPSVSVGSVSLAPTLLTRSKTLYVPVVSQGGAPQTVEPGLLTRTKTLYAPVVVPGSVGIAPPLLTRTKTLYAPFISFGGAVLQPPTVTRVKVVYDPSIAVGGVAIEPPLLTRAKVVYTPVVDDGSIPVVETRKRFAAVRRNYLIQGKRYTLTDFELRHLLQQLIPARSEVQVVEKEDVKQISRKLWKRLRETDSALDALTLKQVDAVVQNATIEYDEDDELVMLLL